MRLEEIRREVERSWGEWLEVLSQIDPDATREPGVCGEWNVHDVVGHVHVGLRYGLSQVRAAFDHVPAPDDEIYGERDPMPEGTPNTNEGRNVAIQKLNAPLGWQQLLDEAVWIRDRALAWVDARTEEELNEDVGFVTFWDPNADKPDDLPIHIRRVSEAPSAHHTRPTWGFVLPDGGGGHMSEHLGQIRAWLEA